MEKSVSIIVPSYNEEKNIEDAIGSIMRAIAHQIKDYEIIVIDDGSKDKTRQIMDRLAHRNKHIKVLHHKQNMGSGYSFKEGISIASKRYIAPFPGDNDLSWRSLRSLLSHADQADFITAYMINPQKRSSMRRVISRLFVILLNSLFGLHLRYYNGPFVCKRSILNTINIYSSGHMIYAEIKIRLLKQGYGYKEIPFEHAGRVHGVSTALKMKNLINTFKTIYILLKKH